MVRRLCIVLIALTIAGCGGSDHERSATTTNAAPASASKVPEPVQVCADAGGGWRPLTFHAHGSRIDAAVLGDGDVGVVFANDSGNSACGWMSFARQLVGRGMRVLAFEYDDESQAAGEGLAAARALRAAGAGHVAMVGASIGGRDTRQFHQVTPAKVNRILLVPGGDHGVDLLSDENGPRVRKTILAFLDANAR